MKVDIKKLTDEELGVKIRNLKAERERTAVALKNYIDEYNLRQVSKTVDAEKKTAKEAPKAAPKTKEKCKKCGCQKHFPPMDELDTFFNDLACLGELSEYCGTHKSNFPLGYFIYMT